MRTVMASAAAHDARSGQLEATGGSLRADTAEALSSLDAALPPRPAGVSVVLGGLRVMTTARFTADVEAESSVPV
jgi:hypothetical protein